MEPIQSKKETAKKTILDSNFDEAITILTALLKENPDDTDLKSYLAIALAQTGNFNESLEIFTELVKISEKEAHHFNYGLILALTKDYSNSIKILNEILEKNPKNLLAWKNLGELYSRIGDDHKANICKMNSRLKE